LSAIIICVGAKEAERTISSVPDNLGDYFRSVGIDTSNVFWVARSEGPVDLVREVRRILQKKNAKTN